MHTSAVTAFDTWAKARLLRLAGLTAVYEPEVVVSFRYPDRKTGALRGVRGVPRNVVELPGIDLDWAIKLLQHEWKSYCGELEVLQSDGVYVVGWKGLGDGVGKEHRGASPGDSIPAAVVDAPEKLDEERPTMKGQ